MTKWLPVWLGELALQGLKMHDCFKTIGFRAGLVNYALGQWSRNSQFETKMVHRGFARFSPEIAGRARAQTRSVTGASMLTGGRDEIIGTAGDYARNVAVCDRWDGSRRRRRQIFQSSYRLGAVPEPGRTPPDPDGAGKFHAPGGGHRDGGWGNDPRRPQSRRRIHR